MKKLFPILLSFFLVSFKCQNEEQSIQGVQGYETLRVTLTTPRIISCAPIGNDRPPRVLIPQHNGEVKILSYNERDKTVATPVPATFKVGYDSAIADLDNDGKNDLVVATLSDNSVEMFEIKPNSTPDEYVQTSLVKNLGHTYGIGVGDLNKDGRVDIAIAEYVGNKVSLLINKGVKKFDLATVSSATEGPQTVQISDMDNDGNMDILTTARSGNKIFIHFGNSQGVFTDVIVSSEIPEPNIALSFDLDKDGFNDILFASRKNPALFFIKNNGHRGFEKPRELILDVPGIYSIAPIDLNGDSHIDFVTASITQALVRFHINDGHNKFTTEVFDRNFSTVQSIATCDLNQDGKLDIIASGANANEVRVYLKK